MIYFLNRIDSIAPLLTLLFFIPIYLKFNKVNRIKYRPILFFLLVQLICNVTATLIEVTYTPLLKNHFFLSNNYWVHWLNTVFSFFIIIYILSKTTKVISSITSKIISISFLIFAIIAIILGDGISLFNSYSAGLSSLIIISLCLLFFYQVLKGNNKNNDESPNTPLFWSISGIFTYYFGSFFIFLTYQYLINNFNSGFSLLWRFHNILLLICCLYIIYGFYGKVIRRNINH